MFSALNAYCIRIITSFWNLRPVAGPEKERPAHTGRCNGSAPTCPGTWCMSPSARQRGDGLEGLSSEAAESGSEDHPLEIQH